MKYTIKPIVIYSPLITPILSIDRINIDVRTNLQLISLINRPRFAPKSKTNH